MKYRCPTPGHVEEVDYPGTCLHPVADYVCGLDLVAIEYDAIVFHDEKPDSLDRRYFTLEWTVYPDRKRAQVFNSDQWRAFVVKSKTIRSELERKR